MLDWLLQFLANQVLRTLYYSEGEKRKIKKVDLIIMEAH